MHLLLIFTLFFVSAQDLFRPCDRSGVRKVYGPGLSSVGLMEWIYSCIGWGEMKLKGESPPTYLPSGQVLRNVDFPAFTGKWESDSLI